MPENHHVANSVGLQAQTQRSSMKSPSEGYYELSDLSERTFTRGYQVKTRLPRSFKSQAQRDSLETSSQHSSAKFIHYLPPDSTARVTDEAVMGHTTHERIGRDTSHSASRAGNIPGHSISVQQLLPILKDPARPRTQTSNAPNIDGEDRPMSQAPQTPAAKPQKTSRKSRSESVIAAFEESFARGAQPRQQSITTPEKSAPLSTKPVSSQAHQVPSPTNQHHAQADHRTLPFEPRSQAKTSSNKTPSPHLTTISSSATLASPTASKSSYEYHLEPAYQLTLSAVDEAALSDKYGDRIKQLANEAIHNPEARPLDIIEYFRVSREIVLEQNRELWKLIHEGGGERRR